MFCSPKQSVTRIPQQTLDSAVSSSRPDQLCFPSPLLKPSKYNKSDKCYTRPLYISQLNNNFNHVENEPKEKLSVKCNAYQSRRSEPFQIGREFISHHVEQIDKQKLKIGVYFATWWALNVVFNIYNKKVLNAFPFPGWFQLWRWLLAP
ncbi:unnamed protein product [Rhodiola kirilowii]